MRLPFAFCVIGSLPCCPSSTIPRRKPASPSLLGVAIRAQLTNIAFIKTHKTASTTLASILYRYGKRHGSNISKFKDPGTVVDLDSAAQQVATRTLS